MSPKPVAGLSASCKTRAARRGLRPRAAAPLAARRSARRRRRACAPGSSAWTWRRCRDDLPPVPPFGATRHRSREGSRTRTTRRSTPSRTVLAALPRPACYDDVARRRGSSTGTTPRGANTSCVPRMLASPHDPSTAHVEDVLSASAVRGDGRAERIDRRGTAHAARRGRRACTRKTRAWEATLVDSRIPACAARRLLHALRRTRLFRFCPARARVRACISASAETRARPRRRRPRRRPPRRAPRRD